MTTRTRSRIQAAACAAMLLAGMALATPATARPAQPQPQAEKGLTVNRAEEPFSCLNVVIQAADRRIGWLTSSTAERPAYHLQSVRLPFVVASKAYLQPFDPQMAKGDEEIGHLLFIDGKGAARLSPLTDPEYLKGVRSVSGPWRGLRLVTAGGPRYDAKKDDWHTNLLYGVDARGQLVRMPVTWRGGVQPVVGAQEVIASGYGQVVALEFDTFRWNATGAPIEDRLVGITRAGAFMEYAVTRARKPVVKTRTLARSGYSGVTALQSSSCMIGQENTTNWGVARSNGTLSHYLDPDAVDRSLAGMKVVGKPLPLPRGVRVL